MRVFRTMKTASALFCALLTLAFASAAAGSVVDGILHDAHVPHDHQHLSFSDIAAAEHCDDAELAPDQGAQDAQGGHMDVGHHHHHHADGPTGFVANAETALTIRVIPAARTVHGDDMPAPRFTGGAERPPKPVSHA